MNNMLFQVFDLVTTFAMMLVFIRFMLQFAGMDARNPMIAPAYKATHIVDVFGRIFPTVGQGRISIAAIVLMFLIRLIDISGKAALTHQGIALCRYFSQGRSA
ncbi:hypothetical protein PKHYL_02730 [Psychrobacter sp. KH172YL61]|uniref:hypothetical protein n=1 Tax=Psychrobacter sp. KH172YL61 TaxID=2517899 RepID=UPI0010B52248|nr:hypothetical protein [Psychrobacter sp. KH172YL61]BBI66082.1 hypothetical protein PKHYL_02730 [Psychrobacter sp. KH172YL61]